MQVFEVMTPDVVSVGPEATLMEAAQANELTGQTLEKGLRAGPPHD